MVPRQLLRRLSKFHPLTYEIGLATMSLEKGFSVFFAAPKLDGTHLRSQRLRQASAILISIDDAIAELNIETQTES